MEKWSFNRLLFSRLPDVLDISGTEIARRCGLTQQVLSRYTTNEIDVSVQVLMKICNSLRMPIRFFISEGNHNIIPSREDATIPAESWKPVAWDSAAVERTFGDGEGKIYWKDVAGAMGVSSQKPHERFLLRTRFPITDFLATCNSLSLPPFRFLVDNNRDSGRKGRDSARTNKDLHEEVRKLREDVRRLHAVVDDLTEKYESLLKAYEELARSIRANIGTEGCSSIGFTADTPPERK